MKYLFHNAIFYCRFRKVLLIMKLTFMFLTAFVLSSHARSSAQTVTLKANDLPLGKVCKEVERQTGYYFVYTKDINESNWTVSIDVKGASLEETLAEMFMALPFDFRVIDKSVVISTIHADELIKVEGLVYSEQGQPLVGATIHVKQSGKSVFTNAKGEFKLTGVQAGSILIISYVGFANQEVIAKEGTLRIKLTVSNSILDAPIIKGYYSTSNRLNPGNAVTLKAEDIERQPVSDPILALEGRVAGLSIVQSSGMPGAYSTVQIRGRNSLDMGLDPLYIIDGMPYSNNSQSSGYITGPLGSPATRDGASPQNNGKGLSPFNNLNPSDIESITVLKDADATAIYGSRGANGVILITTKRGGAGRIKVEGNVQYGGSTIAKSIDLLNTPEYLSLRREALKNDGVAPNPNIDYDLTYWDTTRYTDWRKVIIGNTATFLNTQATASGGNASTQFLVGVGYTSQGTVFPGNFGDKKGSIHASVNSVSNDQRFRLDFSYGYTNDNNRLPFVDPTPSILTAPDAPPIFDKNGNFNWQMRGARSTFINPLAFTKNRSSSITDNEILNLGISYLLFTGLKISSRIGYTHSEIEQSSLRFSSSVQPPNNILASTRTNNEYNSDLRSWIIEPQVNYDFHIKNWMVQTSIGSTFQSNKTKSVNYGGSGYLSDALVENVAAAASASIGNYFVNLYRYTAAYARAGFNYKDKYILNVTGRRDGSSRFGPRNQFGNFGAVGAAWIFTKEPFVNQDWLSFLSFGKLRGSVGVTGNDQLPEYKYLDSYSSTSSTYQDVPLFTPTQLTNAYYEWETVKKIEGGIELGFLQDRCLVSVSYYRNRTNNQLVNYLLPVITGFSNIQGNLPAIIQNSGWELTFDSKNIETKNFKWTTSLNLSIPRNLLVAYPNIETSPYAYTYAVGKPLSTRFRFHYTGVDPETGLYTVSTKNGSKTPAFTVDQSFTEGVAIDFLSGISNTFIYKGFQLNVFVQVVKQLGTNYLASFSLPGKYNVNMPKAVISRWRNYGDQSAVQKASANTAFYPAYYFFQNSDATISDASYLRLKNVGISYNLNSAQLRKTHIYAASIYFHAQNLFTVTKYAGLDPESQGIYLPPMRTMTLGLRVTF